MTAPAASERTWRRNLLPALLAATVGWFVPSPSDAAPRDPLGAESQNVIPPIPCDQGQIDHPLHLADAIQLSLCNNPQTRLQWAAARTAAAQLGTAQGGFIPSLSVSGSSSNNASQTGAAATTRNSSRVIGLSASYLLYDFGAREAGIENARQLLYAANASRDASLQSVYLSTVQAWYAVLSSRASVAAYQAAATAAKTSLDAAIARYQSGSATPADRLQAQTALSQAELNLIQAEGTAATAAGTLMNMMGYSAEHPFELAEQEEARPDAASEQAVGELIAQARGKRPDLQAADAQIKAAEAQLKAARAANMPSFTLTASTSRSLPSNGPTTQSNSVGLAVSMPILNGLKNTYQIRAAEAQLESRVADRQRVANQVALDVWKAYQALLTNSQALRTANDLQDSAEQSERMTLGRYQAGLGNLLDVLNAQSALASARQQRITALYNYQSSRFALTQAIGELDLTQLP